MKIAHLGFLAAALVAIGCGSGSEGGGATTTTTAGSASATGGKPAASGEKLKVGLVFDSGGKGDKSFNDSAYAGIEKAKKDLNIDDKSIDSKSEKDYATNLAALADGGCKVIFAVGLGQADALKAVAPKYPDVKFGLVDGELKAPNVRCLLFAEEQGSFLAGYAAALVSKTHKIGFVGGMNIPLITKFLVGYTAGAKYADPKIEVLPPKYTNNWVDVGLGKAAAKVLFDSGADIVYHASGRCGLGVISAAKDAGKLAIGVDGNQDGEAPGFVLTSMMKSVDTAVYNTIKDVEDNKFTPDDKVYDLASGGVGLTDFALTKDKIGEANLKKLDEIKKLVASGKINVPKTQEELAGFKPTP